MQRLFCTSQNNRGYVNLQPDERLDVNHLLLFLEFIVILTLELSLL